jgi:hypothetical protein
VPLIHLRELRVNFGVFFPLGFEPPPDMGCEQVSDPYYLHSLLRGIFGTDQEERMLEIARSIPQLLCVGFLECWDEQGLPVVSL